MFNPIDMREIPFFFNSVSRFLSVLVYYKSTKGDFQGDKLFMLTKKVIQNTIETLY